MNLLSPKYIKELLGKQGTFPLKRLGQNFLVNKGVAEKVIKAADLKPDDIVLEIGPGIGGLTQELAKRVGKVIAVEKDQNLAKILNEELRIKNIKNVEIIQGDILKIENCKLIENCKATLRGVRSASRKIGNYKVVANLPYYITSPVIRMFLEAKNPPETMVLIVQKEVAQRICASPPDMNLLAVSVQFYAEPKIISYISKNSFWPSPKVDAAIIKIVPRCSAYGSALFREQFFRIVKAGFSHPRKQLANNLTKGLELNKEKVISWLLKNKIKPEQRAETLTIKNWINLVKLIDIVCCF